MKLIIFCVECGERLAASFDDGKHLSTTKLYQEHRWLLSVVDPVDVTLAPVCAVCAPKVYPPELLAAARKSMEKKN